VEAPAQATKADPGRGVRAPVGASQRGMTTMKSVCTYARQATASRWRDRRRLVRLLLPPLVLALTLLADPAAGQAQRTAAPCHVACWYRIAVLGDAVGDYKYVPSPGDDLSDKSHSSAGFKLESIGAVIVGPALDVYAELSGHLTSYTGHRHVTHAYHIADCTVETDSSMRGEPPLGAILSLDGPSLRLGVTYDPLPLLNFFHNHTPAYKCGSNDVDEKASDDPWPQVSAGPSLTLPREGEELHITSSTFSPVAFAAGTFTIKADYGYKSPGCVHCYTYSVNGEVIIDFKRCPDQHLHWNCPIRGWDPLPKPPRHH